jgi:hypothetical protein
MSPRGLWSMLLWWEDEENLTNDIQSMRMDKKYGDNSDVVLEINWEEFGDWYWNEVLESLEQRPREASVKQYKQYPLQRYLNRCFEEELQDWKRIPMNVCKKMIQCSDDAIQHLDLYGETLLQTICWSILHSPSLQLSQSNNLFFLDDDNLSNNLVVILYRAYPKALTIPNRHGQILFHYYGQIFEKRHSLDNNNHNMWEYLITQSPTSFVHSKDNDGYTPLDILWENLTTNLPDNNNNNDNSNDEKSRPWQWEYLAKLLRIAATAQRRLDLASNIHNCMDQENIDDNYLLPEMHSIVYLQCPHYIIQKFSHLYSHQLILPETEMFRHYTPLAIACTYNNYHRHHNWKKDDKPKCITCLLTSESADIPCNNKKDEPFSILPLHLTLQHGNVRYHQDAISSLIKASPLSLSICDPKHHFYPFLLAAVSSKHTLAAMIDFTTTDIIRSEDDNDNENSIQQLESIYFLLREVPWIIEHYTFT